MGVRFVAKALLAVAMARPMLGCTVGALDLSAKPWPCSAEMPCDEADGWTCDPVEKVCVQSGAATACNAERCIDAGSFDIDAAEVTAAEYQQFLDAGVATDSQPGKCLWNATFAPLDSEPDLPIGCGPGQFDPASRPNVPVTCVDWCDAFAYCAWKGRHLCGRIGGGSLTLNELGNNDPAASEWYAACSQAGQRAYPYGDMFDPTACNTQGVTGTLVDVEAEVRCEGGYPGLFDMSGNAMEWEDACDPVDTDPSHDTCALRGGAFWGAQTETACAYVTGTSYDLARSATYHDFGFRCCGTH